ncbi:hypothetical protein PUN28_014401 [Cardiocondyla obscurior]|uniref:Uncharacterized protein n=1 Tax=Cardiocondyla obscurior TaxID=286306 RepID=A0AAW2F236_9HYME
MPRSVDTTYSDDKFADFSTREISCVSELSEVFPMTSGHGHVREASGQNESRCSNFSEMPVDHDGDHVCRHKSGKLELDVTVNSEDRISSPLARKTDVTITKIRLAKIFDVKI